MCSASAQDAQYAAGAIRLADLTPKPPRRMGNVANSRACCWSDGPPGNPPNSASMVRCMLVIGLAAMSATCGGTLALRIARRFAMRTEGLEHTGLLPTVYALHPTSWRLLPPQNDGNPLVSQGFSVFRDDVVIHGLQKGPKTVIFSDALLLQFSSRFTDVFRHGVQFQTRPKRHFFHQRSCSKGPNQALDKVLTNETPCIFQDILRGVLMTHELGLGPNKTAEVVLSVIVQHS